jgi:amidohydrolase
MIGLPSYHAIAAMAVTVAMFVAFARGRMPVEIISLLTIAVIAVGLYFFPLPDTQPTDGLSLAFSGFGHYALITICALMIMGRGLVVTGALEPAARFLERVFKINGQLGLLVSLLVAMILSMAVNDTPVMVLLLPIFVQLAARGGLAASKTLIPLNAAILIGGMATTIGTSTNILVVSIAVDLGMRQLDVFAFTPIVFVAALVAIPYLWLVMPRMLGDNSVADVAHQRIFEARLRITESSILNGRELSEVIKRLPAGVVFSDVPLGLIRPSQRLRMRGTHEAIEEAARILRGDTAPSWVLDRIKRRSDESGIDIAVVEMTVTADSRLIGRSLPSSGIADLYGVAVIGTHRPERLVGEKDQFNEGGDLKILEGDVLLVMGLPDDLQHFAAADSLLTLEGMRELPRRSKALLSGAIMVGSVALASLGLVPIAISALAGAILMFVTGCVRFDRAGRALSGKVIVLVASSIALGKIILDSGAADWIGTVMAAGLQFLPPAAALAAVMLSVTFLTNFASNATAATVGTPIAFSIAHRLGLPPEPMVLAVLFGCNLCYATPIAYQTNMLIMSEGSYEFKDYNRRAAGAPYGDRAVGDPGDYLRAVGSRLRGFSSSRASATSQSARAGGVGLDLNPMVVFRMFCPLGRPEGMSKSSLMAFASIAALAASPAQADDLRATIAADMPGLMAIYRDLHQHPELSFQEVRTAKVLADAAREAGFTVTQGVGRTGIVAVLENGPGPTVLIRTDMDALPVVEQTGLPFASTARGVPPTGGETGIMHACGHDTHMTSWIETARLMAAHRADWSGTLVMIGQPAEETGEGAEAMLKDGLYTRFPEPDYALAFHDMAGVPAGTITYASGPAMANVDSVDIFVKGVGGHGAAPQTTKDPIVLASAIVMRLQTLVSRENNPIEPAVVTVGSFHAGSRYNIISDAAHLQLTVRSFTDEQRARLIDGIKRIVAGEAMASGIPAELMPEVKFGEGFTPSLINEPGFTAEVMGPLTERFGADRVKSAPPIMPGEDFSRYRRADPAHVQSVMFWVGGERPEVIAGAEKTGKTLPSLHSPFWAPDAEKVVGTAAEALTSAAMRLMAKG